MSRATRREALSAGLFTALAGVAAVAVATPDHAGAAGAHPDAALFTLCDEIAAIERQWAASVDVSSALCIRDPHYAAMDAHECALSAQQKPLIERLNEMPTHTPAGYRARARLIVLSDYGHVADEDGHNGMVWALVSALAGETSHG